MDSTTDTECSQIMQKSKEKGRKNISHILIMTAVFLFRENPWKPRPKSAEFDIDIGNIDHSLTRVVTKDGKINTRRHVKKQLSL